MYAVNNTVVIDLNGLFIYVDPGYPGSFHDVNILRHSDLFRNWREYFEHRDNYSQFLLGDPGYRGEEMFIMSRIGQRQAVQTGNLAAIDAYNSMHAGQRVQVEWGIGGLKRKWRRLMKRFDAKLYKFSILFYACAILTNFIHRRRGDMTSIVEDGEAGWDGDY